MFSNPSWKGVGTVSSTVIKNITAVSVRWPSPTHDESCLTRKQSNLAYSARFAGNTTVLSTRYATDGIIGGLLYVPDLPWGSTCILETAPHVPLSAVRQVNLPPTNYHLIAIAPWVNERCASAYLASARTAPVRAVLFYLPGTASAPPPPADSDEWHINDSADWMSQTAYPVFAVSGMAGDIMMQHLSLYSGNMTEVPFGHDISERFLADPEDYLRIWTELDISTSPMTFATWVYALIIIGVLLVVITTTSFLMHFVQASRRAGLRRRVMRGEVNLEAMGIKHLTVPLGQIQKFPLYTYHYEPATASPPLSPRSAMSARTRSGTHSLRQTESGTAPRAARHSTASELGLDGPFAASTAAIDYQPRCEICLEPHENRVSIIRELSCGHIFHPECIDEFLHEVSSLCPICKASMLPKGYCPKVTNAMVRRERAIRRLRGRVDAMDDSEGPEDGQPQSWWEATKSRLFGVKSGSVSSTSTELQETQPKPKKPPPQRRRSQARPSRPEEIIDSRGAATALARERMRELAGMEPDDGEAGMTRCTSALYRFMICFYPDNLTGQRMRARIFPGFY